LSISIKLDDLPRFAQAAKNAGKVFSRRDVPLELDTLAQRILTTAKKGSPVLTGALRASGRVKRQNQYVRIVQFGGSGTGVDYATFVEFGTFRQKPKPFLRPAVLAHRNDMGKRFSVSINKRFSKLAQQFPPKGV
jgi:HK97 gp10 family phage protein